ncbi:hypothetical protein ST47_g4998 [Ascochyta rabiei]|uniref:Uncharacterized protein n=1 Tax=Didymella rabiei TaxID=5454 RepID=A0A163EPY6_DIDRA|nr:hypothetical protein ST47_g4998 [Ascochyta rabiei]
MTIIGGAFGVAGGVAWLANPGAGAFLGTIGGLLRIASSIKTQADIKGKWARNATAVLNTRLGTNLNSTSKAIQLMANVVFREGNFSKIRRSTLAYKDNEENKSLKTDVAKFFADGKFIEPVLGADYDLFKEKLVKALKASLVSTALLLANEYILRNAHTLNNCEKNNRKKLNINSIREYCYTLEYPSSGRKNLHPNQVPKTKQLSQAVDKDMLKDKVETEYKAPLSKIIYVLVDCQQKQNTYLRP